MALKPAVMIINATVIPGLTYSLSLSALTKQDGQNIGTFMQTITTALLGEVASTAPTWWLVDELNLRDPLLMIGASDACELAKAIEGTSGHLVQAILQADEIFVNHTSAFLENLGLTIENIVQTKKEDRHKSITLGADVQNNPQGKVKATKFQGLKAHLHRTLIHVRAIMVYPPVRAPQCPDCGEGHELTPWHCLTVCKYPPIITTREQENQPHIPFSQWSPKMMEDALAGPRTGEHNAETATTILNILDSSLLKLPCTRN